MVLIASVKVFIVLILVIHGILAFGLGLCSGLGKVDTLAASTAAAVDDVVGGDGLEVTLVVVFLF